MKELTDLIINKLKKEVPIKIGNNIRLLRKQKGLTQTELGRLTGKDRQYIYKIEKGVVTPNIATIAIIASALDIELKEIFRDILL